MVKYPTPMWGPQETQVRSLGGKDPLEEEVTTHCSVLALGISWTEEPGELQFMELQSQTRLSMHTHPCMPKKMTVCLKGDGKFSFTFASVFVIFGKLLH